MSLNITKNADINGWEDALVHHARIETTSDYVVTIPTEKVYAVIITNRQYNYVGSPQFKLEDASSVFIDETRTTAENAIDLSDKGGEALLLGGVEVDTHIKLTASASSSGVQYYFGIKIYYKKV